MTIKPLSTQGLKPSRVQGFLHPCARLVFRLFSSLSRLPWLSCIRSNRRSIRNSQSEIRNAVRLFSPAPLLPCTLALFLLCPPSIVHADWGPEQQVTRWGGSVFSKDAASSGDTIHVLFGESWVDSTGHEEVLYTRSTDAGNTWSPEIMLTNRGGILPRVAVKGNIVHAIWVDMRYGQWDVFYRRSTDGGVTWGPEIRFSFNADPGSTGDIITDDGDDVYAFWISGRGTRFRKSMDQGATWSQDTIITPYAGYMVAAWSSGVLKIVWEDTRYTTVEVFSKQSSDRGDTWGPDTILSMRDIYPSQMSNLAVDSVGNFFATWMDFKYSPYSMTGDIFMRVSRDSGASWLPEDTVMFSHRGVRSSVLPWRGYLHIVYEDVRDRPGTMDYELYGRISTNQGVSFGPETRLTYSAPRSMMPVLVGTRDRVHLLWSESKVADTLSELYHRCWEPGTGVEEDERDEPVRRQEFKIAVSPNPMTSEVRIAYALPKASPVDLTVYNISGQVVRRLASESSKAPGRYSIRWDGKNDQGHRVPAGVYFYRLNAGSFSETRKLVAVR